MTFSVLLNTDCGLRGSQELEFGLQDLHRALQANAGLTDWLEFDGSRLAGIELDQISALDSEQLLVVLNPALIVSDNLMRELTEVLRQNPQACVVPGDPRCTEDGWQIDYASRGGFERYVARREHLSRQQQGNAAQAWVYLVKRQVLLTLLLESATLSWQAIAQRMPGGCLVAQRAFVHSYADYQKSERLEIVRMVPAGVQKLVDVGGGEGGFLRAFQRNRASEVLLVEPNMQSAAVARQLGTAVLAERFESLDSIMIGGADCISFLDVLEHFENPLAALRHAHKLLPAGGRVILSVPNVGHWSVVQDLLHGRFDYLPLGILCCTHLRFFTERSLRQLLADANFLVQTWHNQPSPLPAELAQALGIVAGGTHPWNLTSLGTDSFHVVACKSPAHAYD